MTTKIEILLENLLKESEAYGARQTETLSAVRGLSANSVLESGVWKFGVDGTIERSYRVDYAGVAVSNYGSGDVWVVAGPVSGGTPDGGTGTVLVRSGRGLVVALVGTVLGCYGTSGDRLGLQVFSRPIQPAGWTV